MLIYFQVHREFINDWIRLIKFPGFGCVTLLAGIFWTKSTSVPHIFVFLPKH